MKMRFYWWLSGVFLKFSASQYATFYFHFWPGPRPKVSGNNCSATKVNRLGSPPKSYSWLSAFWLGLSFSLSENGLQVWKKSTLPTPTLSWLFHCQDNVCFRSLPRHFPLLFLWQTQIYSFSFLRLRLINLFLLWFFHPVLIAEFSCRRRHQPWRKLEWFI